MPHRESPRTGEGPDHPAPSRRSMDPSGVEDSAQTGGRADEGSRARRGGNGSAPEAAATEGAAGGDAGAAAGEEVDAQAPAAEGGEPLREQFLRLAAEFDNYRKRQSRERLEAWSRAKADLIEKLLPAVDDLERVAHPEVAGSADAATASVLAGVELVLRKLLQTLEREGLERIEATDEPFDPTLHEALLTRPTADPALDGRIAQVVLPGYRFADRLLRPAKVVVWKHRP